MHGDPQPRLRQERNVCEACTVAGSGARSVQPRTPGLQHSVCVALPSRPLE